MRGVSATAASVVCAACVGVAASLVPTLVPSLFPGTGVALAADPAAAAPLRPSVPAAAPRKSVTPAIGPQWNDLNASQRTVLAPIASLWNDLGDVRKRKWLLIARNYPSMSPTEQAKLRERMTEWASLTRQQRDQARLNYQAIRKVPADQRAAQWEAYQALSPEQKRQFAQRAPAHPSGLATVSAGRPMNTPALSAVPRRHATLGARPVSLTEVHPAPPASPAAPGASPGEAAPHPDTIAPPARSPYEDEPAN